MAVRCPRCHTSNPSVARFCRNCGLVLEVGARGVLGAGRAPHPQPLAQPGEYEPIESAVDLYCHWEAVGGGPPLLGTESLMLTVFNGGYDLDNVVLRIRGCHADGRELMAVERAVQEWSRGALVSLELPSYELPDAIDSLRVELVQAEFRV